MGIYFGMQKTHPVPVTTSIIIFWRIQSFKCWFHGPKQLSEKSTMGIIQHQWLFLVPLICGMWHIIPQLAVYTTYISRIYCLLGGLYATYHLLRGTTISHVLCRLFNCRCWGEGEPGYFPGAQWGVAAPLEKNAGRFERLEVSPQKLRLLMATRNPGNNSPVWGGW